jgi:repressor LexA
VVQVGVEWLRRFLKEKNITQKELAARLGVSSSLVSSWFSGAKAIAPRHLREIARLFSLSEQEVFSLAGLLSEAEVSPEVVMVPVLSESIPCGTPKEAFDEYVVGLHPMLREMLELGVGKAYRYGLKLYFLRAEGDSMVEAGITPGSFVLFSPDLEVQSGDIAVVEVDEEGLTVKQVFLRGNLVVLQPRNSRYEPRILEREEVSIKGKVLLVLNYLNHLRRV